MKLSEKRMPHGRLAMLRDSCMSRQSNAWYCRSRFSRGRMYQANAPRHSYGVQNGGLNSGSPNPAPMAKIGSLREETSRALAQASPAKALLPCDGLELVRGGQRIGQTVSSARCLLVLAERVSLGRTDVDLALRSGHETGAPAQTHLLRSSPAPGAPIRPACGPAGSW